MDPTSNSIYICTVLYALRTSFCTFGADLHAQSALINSISASELSGRFIKSALLVGENVFCTISDPCSTNVRVDMSGVDCTGGRARARGKKGRNCN